MDYSKDYFSFKGGKRIHEYEINKWIEDGCSYLKQNEDAQYYYISSGNTIVFIHRSDDDELVVRVCKDYEEKYYKLEDV